MPKLVRTFRGYPAMLTEEQRQHAKLVALIVVVLIAGFFPSGMGMQHAALLVVPRWQTAAVRGRSLVEGESVIALSLGATPPPF